jgi:imidazolonepropionase-like amidohydrolase/ABC-type multidrug transport system permease subunit
MKSCLALIVLDLKLALRQRFVILFNYLLPLMFFFVYLQAFHTERGPAMAVVLSMVTSVGIIGNGLFGGGIEVVQERDVNILRRYKVTPLTQGPLLVASTIAGWILFMPLVLVLFMLAHWVYGMPWPGRAGSLFLFITLSVIGFRCIGLILASVSNSMQESQILVQSTYLPMLFVSGATFPLSMFPSWLLALAQFLPATYLVSGMQAMMLRNESIMDNVLPVIALIITTAVGFFLAHKLFRWEKEERVRTSSKLWVFAVMLPFVVLGSWQMHSQQNIAKAKILARQLVRNQTYLIRGARIFVGDGKVIEKGAVLVRGGKIAEVYEGIYPKPTNLLVIEAAGKTILPGLIDLQVHLGEPGGFDDSPNDDPKKNMLSRLAAYLYSGVTTVRSVDDSRGGVLKIRSVVNNGEQLGAELFACGALFTADDGYDTDSLRQFRPPIRGDRESESIRLPSSIDEGRHQVDELKRAGVDCIEAIFESGAGTHLYNRLDPAVFSALAREAHVLDLPLSVHTGDAHDVADALGAKATSVEHGSFRDAISDASFEKMAQQKTFYDPTLSVGEAFKAFAAGNTRLLKRSLVQQVTPAGLLQRTEEQLSSKDTEALRDAIGQYPIDMHLAGENLKRAQLHGVILVAGSDAGNFLVFHGPTVQHELQLWVEAGISPAVALQAATYNAACLLKADNRIGSIRPGNDADLLVVDGNPLEDITATERISFVVFKGERIDRSEASQP